MNLLKSVLLVFITFLSPYVIAAGATKVAVVDVQSVVLLSEAGKKGMEELEKHPKYTPVKTKLENAEAELKTLDEQAQNEGLTWGEDKKKEHREKMTKLAKERQEYAKTLNAMRESAFVQMLGALEPRIGMALEQIMTTEGIELIIDSKAAIVKSPSADITAMVIDRLNKINEKAMEEAKKAAENKKD